MDCRQWIEGIREELEVVSDLPSYLAGLEIDSVSFRHSEVGECIGGEIWINDSFEAYCISDRFAFTVSGDKVVASELFSEELQKRLEEYFQAMDINSAF